MCIFHMTFFTTFHLLQACMSFWRRFTKLLLKNMKGVMNQRLLVLTRALETSIPKWFINSSRLVYKFSSYANSMYCV